MDRGPIVQAQPPVGLDTPCRGMWLRRTKDGAPVVFVHYTIDPKKDLAWATEREKKFSSRAWWELEMEARYSAMSGQLVYPEFDENIHVIPHSMIPKRGCRYMSIDPHPRTPHALLWVLLDVWNDVYVYREIWPSVVYGTPNVLRDDTPDHQFTVRDYAEQIARSEGNKIAWSHEQTDHESGAYRQCPGGERIIERFADQAGKGFRASGEADIEESYSEKYWRFGISCSDPLRTHTAGEDAIRQLLRPRWHEIRGNWPRLHISANCPELVLEFQHHRYQQQRRPEDRELKQDPIAVRTHLLDTLRYLCTADLSYVESMAS